MLLLRTFTLNLGISPLASSGQKSRVFLVVHLNDRGDVDGANHSGLGRRRALNGRRARYRRSGRR